MTVSSSVPATHSPAKPGTVNVSSLMLQVMLALVPGTLVSVWFFGAGVVVNILGCCVMAVAIEATVLKLRSKALKPSLSDNTALLTAWLFALTLPPLVPWWVLFFGISAAMLLGKHLYGGTGHNPFNPAMLGYAFVIICFPREVTAWLAPAGTAAALEQALATPLPGFWESARITLNLTSLDKPQWDAITMATPLDRLKHLNAADGFGTGAAALQQGWFAAYAWEWINLAWLAGGLWMLWRRLISWHIPVSVLLALGGCYCIAWLVPTSTSLSPLFGLFSGAAMLGAFFIATDPVSAATSLKGKLIFGAGIGFITYFIREFGNYPEGIAFAVLLMNIAAPTIDYFSRPTVAK